MTLSVTRRCRQRANHGAPPLEWSNDCFENAQKQAHDCELNGELGHGHIQGKSGRHGQNAYGSTGQAEIAGTVQAWYDEVKDYDFAQPGFAGNTGHFTQNVWVESKWVGLARSQDGHYIIANFFPAGNLNMQGAFEQNVMAGGADMATRTPPPKLGVTAGTEWTDAFGAALAGCPFTEFAEKIKAALAAGHGGTTVTVTREATSVKIAFEDDHSIKTQRGSWG